LTSAQPSYDFNSAAPQQQVRFGSSSSKLIKQNTNTFQQNQRFLNNITTLPQHPIFATSDCSLFIRLVIEHHWMLYEEGKTPPTILFRLLRHWFYQR
jgi:hypothetical protein